MGPCQTRINRKSHIESNDEVESLKSVDQKLNNLKFKDPELDCPEGQRVTKLCLNQKCQHSLRCADVSCPSCGKGVHPLCYSLSIDQITEMLNDRVNLSKDFIVRVLKEEQAAVLKIKNNQQQIFQKLTFSSLEKTSDRAVIEIYQKRNQQGLSGKQANQLRQRLQEEQQKNNSHIKKLIDIYSRQIDVQVEKFKKLRENILKAYLKQTIEESSKHASASALKKTKGQYQFMPISNVATKGEPKKETSETRNNSDRKSVEEKSYTPGYFSEIKQQKQEPTQTYSTTGVSKLENQPSNSSVRINVAESSEFKSRKSVTGTKVGANLIELDTKIIDAKSSDGEGQIAFLRRSLDYPRNINLLFRASEHNFSAEAFHQACDGKNDTLVILKTDYGKILGGYSHYKWDQERNGKFVNDKERRAFLLQFNKKEKMVAQRDNRLICCNSSCGPNFGWNDLVISDNCNLYSSSLAEFPCTFNRDGSPYRQEAQESLVAFTGVTSGIKFKVEEYEVFQVEFNEEE